MNHRGILFAFALLATAGFGGSSPAWAQCTECAASAAAELSDSAASGPIKRPIRLEITAALDFGPLVAGSGSGSARLDAATGDRVVSGDLASLGGYALRGEVLVEGEPNETVRIDMPRSIELTTIDGEEVRVDDITTTLGANARLGPDGTLRFSFGGRLDVAGGLAGDFRGRIPITAHYL